MFKLVSCLAFLVSASAFQREVVHFQLGTYLENICRASFNMNASNSFDLTTAMIHISVPYSQLTCYGTENE